MLYPSAMIILAVLVPVMAAIILLAGQFFLPERVRDRRLATVASIIAFASVLILTLTVVFSKTLQISESVSIENWAVNFQLAISCDRITIVWLLLSATVVSQTLLFSKVPVASNRHSFQILTLLLLGVSQAIVLVNDAKWQWLILSSSTWLLYGALQITPQNQGTKTRVTRSLIMFVVADLFWMLGLLGIYLITGTVQIPELTNLAHLGDFSESQASLFITSVLSLILSIVIRTGLFPAIVWTNEFTENPTRMALLAAFPLSMGGFLFFRWLPVIRLFPEPLTILVGLAALSAVLTAVSALFQSGLKQLQRLTSVLLAFVFIGIAADEKLVPQMAGLFAGTILFSVTLSLSTNQQRTKLSVFASWCSVTLLLCGTFGVEATLRAIQHHGGANQVEIPTVMLPLLVLTLGLFLFGLFDFFRLKSEETSTDKELTHSVNSLWGGLSLLGISFVPFFIDPAAEYVVLLPFYVSGILLVSFFIARIQASPDDSSREEISALIKLCRHDYHVESVLRKGISIPIQVGSLVIHVFDKYLLQGLVLNLARWMKNEIIEASQECDKTATTLSISGLTLMSLLVLILAVYFGISSS